MDCGCDNGTLSCFLASLCPNSEIVAIDRCQKAIENARLLAKRLNLTNIEFHASAVEDFSSGVFDTVFASRILHENGKNIDFDPTMNYWTRAKEISTQKDAIVNILCSFVAPQGNIVNICRNSLDVDYLGNLISFSNSNYLVNPEQLKHFYFSDSPDEEPEEFVAACFTKSDAPMPLGGDDVNQIDTLANLFCFLKQKDGFDFKASMYEGDSADLMKTIRCGIPRKITRLFTEDRHLFCGECSIWDNPNDSTAFWFYLCNNNREKYLVNVEFTKIGDYEKNLTTWKENSLKNGGLVSEEM